MPRTEPYGTWESPVSAWDVARASVRLGEVATGPDGSIWWTEMRPVDGGRVMVVRWTEADGACDMLPAGFSARNRVHEYGGRPFCLVGTTLVFTNWSDQRLYAVPSPDAAGDRTPSPLTAQPSTPQGDRYADLVAAPGDAGVWCVRERDVDGGVRRDIVHVGLDGELRALAADGHFLAAPRPSPDGRRACWLTWEHPLMPWDGTRLRVADLQADGTAGAPVTVMGGDDESLFDPVWLSDDEIVLASDRTGFWNLYGVRADGQARALHPAEEEFGTPLWQLGYRLCVPTGDGRLAALHGTATLRLGILDPGTGTLDDVAVPFTSWSASLAVTRDGAVVAVAGTPTAPDAVVCIRPQDGTWTEVHCASSVPVDAAYLPQPTTETFEGPDGREVHAVVYRPRHPEVVGPPDERPPYVVFVHGGPTAQVVPHLDEEKAYFTSRGIGVLDVNYGGSSGFGRAYRQRLNGAWGVVDVDDSAAAARALAQRGEADAARLAIRGGSAGGWTTLVALVRSDVFACGTSYFGVTDLLSFVAATHDFESRYVDSLVGPLPQAEQLYRERSPLSHMDSFTRPVLVLQGLEDKVVPPSQAEVLVEELARRGVPHRYLAFPGEQHGFRIAANVVAALEAELAFYGQVFGFAPAGVQPLELVGG